MIQKAANFSRIKHRQFSDWGIRNGLVGTTADKLYSVDSNGVDRVIRHSALQDKALVGLDDLALELQWGLRLEFEEFAYRDGFSDVFYREMRLQVQVVHVGQVYVEGECEAVGDVWEKTRDFCLEERGKGLHIGVFEGADYYYTLQHGLGDVRHL